MAMSSGGGSREGSAKATVADQIAQAVQSTSNLLQLMQQSSQSQAELSKLPKSLLAKTETIRNTGQVLHHLPMVVSSIDAHIENGLHSLPHLQTVILILSNMERCQLPSLAQSHQPQEPEPKLADRSSEA